MEKETLKEEELYQDTVGRCNRCGRLTDDRARFVDSPKDEVGYLDWCCESCKEKL